MQEDSEGSQDESEPSSRERDDTGNSSSPEQPSDDRSSEEPPTADRVSETRSSSGNRRSIGERDQTPSSRREDQRDGQEQEEQVVSDAKDQMFGPALALIITAGISLALRLIYLGFQLIGLFTGEVATFQASSEAERIGQRIGYVIGVSLAFLFPLIDGMVIYGAVQMKNLRSWGLGLTASIISCIPCLSPLCIVGIPFGIWGIIALNQKTVKEAFEIR